MTFEPLFNTIPQPLLRAVAVRLVWDLFDGEEVGEDQITALCGPRPKPLPVVGKR